jgi:hypothetical protein
MKAWGGVWQEVESAHPVPPQDILWATAAPTGIQDLQSTP